MIEVTRICDICGERISQEVLPDFEGCITYPVNFTCSDCMLAKVRMSDKELYAMSSPEPES